MPNVIRTLDCPVSGLGTALLVSDLVGPKTLDVIGIYQGTVDILASHDGTNYVPIFTFNSGGGPQQISETMNIVARFIRTRCQLSTSSSLSASLSAQLSVNGNQFLSLATLTPGQSGPTPIIDTWSLIPTSGVEPVWSIFCKGSFNGMIVIEGSQDETNFVPLTAFSASRNTLGSFENSELINRTVRYLRINAQAIISENTVITMGGESSDDVGPTAPDILLHEPFVLARGDSPLFLNAVGDAGFGADLALSTPLEPSHQGIITCYQTAVGFTGVRSALSRNTILIPSAADAIWSHKWIFKMPPRSTAADRYILQFGVGDDIPTFLTKQVTIIYSDNLNGGRFALRAQDAGTTDDDTGITAVEGTWYYAELVLTRESVDLYLDTNRLVSTLVANVTANIPTTALSIIGGMNVTNLTAPSLEVKIDDFRGEFVLN